MDILTAIFVFVLVWWVVIFCVLPWGNHAHTVPERGHAASSPANPRLKQKLLWTTAIAFFLTAAMMAWTRYTGFSLHHWVKAWAENS